MTSDLIGFWTTLTSSFELAELKYIFLVLGLFVFPRLIVHYGIPLALTAFAMGVGSHYYLNWFVDDTIVGLLSLLGISALFLFAGLEVEFEELIENRKVLIGHVATRLVLIVLLSSTLVWIFQLSWSASIIFALALVTPSAGFIIDSIESTKLNKDQKQWVKMKAIATEIVAIGIFFVVVQSRSGPRALLAFAILGGMIWILPGLLRSVARLISKYAPGSEFSYILILALIFATITKKLGAYYLVGAFVVGMAASRLKKVAPNLVSTDILSSLRFFSTFFMPFYFFNAGVKLDKAILSWNSLAVGIGLFVFIAPLRVLSIQGQRHLMLKDTLSKSLPIAVALQPTLVFGLVLADILRTFYVLPNELLGGLIFYTIIVTTVPSLALKLIRHEPLVARV